MKKQNVRSESESKVSEPKSPAVYERIQKQQFAESFWQFIEDGDLSAHLKRAARIWHGRIPDDSA